jgi:hypothetical protein
LSLKLIGSVLKKLEKETIGKLHTKYKYGKALIACYYRAQLIKGGHISIFTNLENENQVILQIRKTRKQILKIIRNCFVNILGHSKNRPEHRNIVSHYITYRPVFRTGPYIFFEDS